MLALFEWMSEGLVTGILLRGPGVAAAAGCAVLAFVASGCRAEPIAEDGPEADKSPSATGSSPLDEYLGEGAVSFVNGMSVQLGGSGDPWGSLSEAELEWMHLNQEFIAECMRDAGFEYIELVPTATDWPAELTEAYALPDDEFAAKYGYGISTIDVQEYATPDPNAKIVEGMSPSEREAYSAALSGDRDRDVVDQTAGTGLGSGCLSQAEEKANNDAGPQYDHEDFDLLIGELSQLQFRIQYEPRIVDAEEDWAECMREAGVRGVTTVDDGNLVVRNRWDEVTGNVEGQVPREPDADVIKEIRDHEIWVATADRSCRKEFFDETFSAVVNELESEFVEQHGDLLEVFREALAANG